MSSDLELDDLVRMSGEIEAENTPKSKRQKFDNVPPQPMVCLEFSGTLVEFINWVRMLKNLVALHCELDFRESCIRVDCRDEKDGIYLYVTQFNSKGFHSYSMINKNGSHKIIVRLDLLYHIISEVKKDDRVVIKTSMDNESLEIVVFSPAMFKKNPDGTAEQMMFESTRHWALKLDEIELVHTEPLVREFAGRLEISSAPFYMMLKRLRKDGDLGQLVLSDESLGFQVIGQRGSLAFQVKKFTEAHEAQKLELECYKEDGKPAVITMALDYLLKTSRLAYLSDHLTIMLAEPEPGGATSMIHVHAMLKNSMGMFKFWQAGHEDND